MFDWPEQSQTSPTSTSRKATAFLPLTTKSMASLLAFSGASSTRHAPSAPAVVDCSGPSSPANRHGLASFRRDLKRSPGGSSGGQAAIIAAGGSALGIGADSGGSIREPAHNCGVAALKPTRGLLPYTGKFPTNELGIFSYVEVQGPFARFVEDLIYTLPILAGPDGHDPYTHPVSVRDPAQVDLKTLRLSFYSDNGLAAPRADIGELIRRVVNEISPYVAPVSDAVPKISRDTYTAFEELFFYGGDRGQWLHDKMRAMQVTQVAEPFKAILDRAARCEFSVTELRDRLSALDRFKFQMLDFYRDYDVIICPVATGPASSYEKTLAAKEGFNLANAFGPLTPSAHEDLGTTRPVLGPRKGNFQVRWFVISPLPEGVPKPVLDASMRERFAEFDGAGHIIDQTRHPGMHETHSIDIICLLQGEASLILESGETRLRPSNVVIQRGTNHAWNAHGGPALFLAVLIDRDLMHQ